MFAQFKSTLARIIAGVSSVTGMMPLLIFAFSRFFTVFDASAVPYGLIAVTLLDLVLPVIAGLRVRRFKPTWADRLKRGVSPTSIIFLVFVIGFGTFTNLSIYKLMGRYPLIILIAGILPLIGYIIGFLVALICRRPWPVIIAISIETGVQNSGVAILILMYAIPQPQGDLGAVMPIIIALTTSPFLLIAFICQLIVRRVKRSKMKVFDDESAEHSTDTDSKF